MSSTERGDGFADPWNPTPAEIVSWARSDRPQPVEDWDLVLASLEHAPVLLALAADPECPRRGFALGCLTSLVEEAARCGRGDEVRPLVDAVRRAGTPALALWVAGAVVALDGAAGGKTIATAPSGGGDPLGVG